MGRLTRQDLLEECRRYISDVRGAFTDDEQLALAEGFRDLALQSLSQEAVRDEVLVEVILVCDAYASEGDKTAKEYVHETVAELAARFRALNAAAQSGLTSHNEDTELSSGPRPAPAAPDVAEMVRCIDACAKFMEERGESPRAAADLRKAAALLAKLGQGWVPVSERLPDTTREVELAVRGRDGEIYRAFGYFKNDWRTSVYDPGGTVIAWHDLMPLPPSTGASDD